MSKEMNRRDFIKGSLAAGLAATASVGLAGCSSSTADADKGGNTPSDAPQDTATSLESAVTDTKQSQVLVCGAGLSGLAAAVQAAQNGLSVIAIERNPEVGGNGVGVEGIFAIDSKGQKEQGIEIDPGEVIRHEIEFAQNRPNGALWYDLVSHSAGNYDWLLDNGVKFSGLINDYGGLWPTMHWFEGGVAAEGYVPPMKAAAEAAGAQIICDMTAKELVTDGSGAIKGLYAEDAQGNIVKFEAEAVILATGGFSSNIEMINEVGWGCDGHVTLIGSPGHDGDGINMATAAGGNKVIEDACALNGTAIDGFSPKSPTAMALSFGGPYLWVDENRRRCINEDFATSNMMNITVPLHSNKQVWSIANDTIVQAALAGFSNAAAGEADADPMEELQQVVAACPSNNIFKCDTIEELAEKSGLDRDNLVESVQLYNELCAAKKDTQFGKDASLLIPIEQGPYYIYRLDSALQVTMGGIDTNFNMQVVDADMNPIPGLYAIGVDGVRLYREVYPINVGATCCANNIHSGRVAANHIAAALKA